MGNSTRALQLGEQKRQEAIEWLKGRFGEDVILEIYTPGEMVFANSDLIHGADRAYTLGALMVVKDGGKNVQLQSPQAKGQLFWLPKNVVSRKPWNHAQRFVVGYRGK